VLECRFPVVGRITDGVRERLRGLPAAERVTFLPFVLHGEVPALLCDACVGIVPIHLSDPYGVNGSCSPLKVVDYMSVGLPVVASMVRVEDDARAFADAIEVFLRDPERAQRDGSRGRARVETRRTFKVLAQVGVAGYRRLLETGVPASRDSPLPTAVNLAGRGPAC